MSNLKKFIPTIALFILLLTGLASSAQNKYPGLPPIQPEWVRDYPPFRIAGNLYDVGSYDLACYLIATTKGLILINAGLAETVPMIRAHIQALGFKFADIEILLNNQAHFDHVGGMAEIKKLTGAKVMIDENDAQVLTDGGKSDFDFGAKGMSFEPVKADRLLHGHDTLKFGGMQIIALRHPGHTKGATSFLFDVQDAHRTYRVLIANLPSVLGETKLSGMATYPDVGKDYAYTFRAMKKLRFDIWLAAHAGQFGLQKKHKPGDAYNPAAFFDRPGYDAALNDLHQAYLKKLKGQ